MSIIYYCPTKQFMFYWVVMSEIVSYIQGHTLLSKLTNFYDEHGKLWRGEIRVSSRVHTETSIKHEANEFLEKQYLGTRFFFLCIRSVDELFWQKNMSTYFEEWLSMEVYICDDEKSKSKGKLAEILMKDVINAMFREGGGIQRYYATLVPREYDITTGDSKGGDIAIFYYDGHAKVPICLIDVTTARCNGNGKVNKSPGINTASGTAIPVIILPLGGYDVLGYKYSEYQISRFLDEIVRSAIALGMYDSDNPLFFLGSDRKRSFEANIIRRILKGIGLFEECITESLEPSSLYIIRDYLDEMQIVFGEIQERF